MKSTFSVIFYLKRQVVKKDGTVPVMGRITVDGSQTQFSCKLSVDPKLWDTKGGRVTGRSTAALETNRLLDKMRVRINKHYQEIMERDNYVTAEKVKNAFLGLEHRYHTLMQVFSRHNEDYEKQVEAGMKAKATLSKYKTVYKHLQEFLNIRYHVKDIALKELTPAFISDFEMFLRTDKHCCTNTVWLYVCPLRTMVFIAINNEWLTRDPFREYEIKKEETTRSFLTKDEIRQLMEGKLKNAKQELYRDLYLFCAFTGLSFADMRNLTEENIRTYFDDHEWININRQKTGVVSNIRLLDIAKRIIDKYRGVEELLQVLVHCLVLGKRGFGFHARLHLLLVVLIMPVEYLHQGMIAVFKSEKGVLDLFCRDVVVTLHDFLIVLVDAHAHFVEQAVRFECRCASAHDTPAFGVP